MTCLDRPAKALKKVQRTQLFMIVLAERDVRWHDNRRATTSSHDVKSVLQHAADVHKSTAKSKYASCPESRK